MALFMSSQVVSPVVRPAAFHFNTRGKSSHEAADELGILLGDMGAFQQRNEIAI